MLAGLGLGAAVLFALPPGAAEAVLIFAGLGALIVAGWRQKPGLRP